MGPAPTFPHERRAALPVAARTAPMARPGRWVALPVAVRMGSTARRACQAARPYPAVDRRAPTGLPGPWAVRLFPVVDSM
ncbi:hypothetical protein [Actinoplanes philippinensis]|uniref:hypothetical protein n=1 Tax=Actinoplanes philippinensis TaxID=35752 RepID=UPI0019434DC8|nr:hypothetical protein [Actinoplanes philippinensis]